MIYLCRIVLNLTRRKGKKIIEEMKTVVVKNEMLPMFFPQGWKGEVARRIGVNPASMCRILRNPKSPNYAKIVKAARELYGK